MVAYVPPFNGDTSVPTRPFVNAQPEDGIEGSIPSADFFNLPQADWLDFIAKSGQTPSNSDLGQIAKAVQSGRVAYAVASGSNDLTATLVPTPASLGDGLIVHLWCPNANTGAMTFAPNGGAALAIQRRAGGAMASGDSAGNAFLSLIKKGTVWRCLAPVASELVTNLLTTPGSQAAFNSQYVRIEAKRFAGTNPMVLETFFKPVWLNTIYDNQAGVSLSGATDNPPYTISLPVAGTWRADILAVGRSCGGMYCDLQAVATQGGLTNGQVLAHGCMIDSYPAGADAVAVPSLGVGRFVTTGPAKICLVARKTETEANNSALGDDTVTFEGNTDAYVILTREIGSP